MVTREWIALMLRFRLLLIVLLTPVALSAQDVKGSFESWENRDGRDQPDGWSTSAYGASRVDNGRSGRCLSVWNWYSYARGFAALGYVPEPGLVLTTGGIPVSDPPTRVSGYYQYIPGHNMDSTDSAVALVGLKRWNAGTGTAEVVASAELHLPPTTDWLPFELIVPAPTATPDSLTIAFISSISGSCGPDSMNCCYLYVDDVTTAGASGVTTSMDELLQISRVFPNPTNGTSHIDFIAEPGSEYSITIIDMTGSPVVDRRHVDGPVELSRLNLPSGAYRYMIVGRPITRPERSATTITSGGFVVP